MVRSVIGMYDVPVRDADLDDLSAIMTVFDASLLAIGVDTVRERIPDGDVLVYVEGDRILGAIVLDPYESSEGAHIDTLAVRRARREQGIARELVEIAFERYGHRLTVDFRTELRPFYESLGFETEERDDRSWGVRSG